MPPAQVSALRRRRKGRARTLGTEITEGTEEEEGEDEEEEERTRRAQERLDAQSGMKKLSVPHALLDGKKHLAASL